MTPAEQNVINAAMDHHAVSEMLTPYECINGDCDHEGECPEEECRVCEACFHLARECNDEMIPDDVLAKNCAVCVAVSILGWMPASQRVVIT
jgi:hypothetical protein